MAGDCPYHKSMLPQWCAECGGFIGWYCAICGESRVEAAKTPGHCRCVGGSTQWYDGPMPTLSLLVDAAMRMDGIGEITAGTKAAYLGNIMELALVEGGN